METRCLVCIRLSTQALAGGTRPIATWKDAIPMASSSSSLVSLARHPSTESQIAGEGFGAIPIIASQSCSQRSSLAGSPGSSTISSAKSSGFSS